MHLINKNNAKKWGVLIFFFLLTVFSFSSCKKDFSEPFFDMDIYPEIKKDDLVFLQGTFTEGALASDATFKKENNPYIITSDLIVPLDKKLIIEEGVILAFMENTGIIVEGELKLKGSKTHPVSLSSNHFYPRKQFWKGIIVKSSQKNEITFGEFKQSTGGVILEKGSRATISRNIFKENRLAVLARETKEAEIFQNKFHLNEIAVVLQSASPKITENKFIHNQADLLIELGSEPEIINNTFLPFTNTTNIIYANMNDLILKNNNFPQVPFSDLEKYILDGKDAENFTWQEKNWPRGKIIWQ